MYINDLHLKFNTPFSGQRIDCLPDARAPSIIQHQMQATNGGHMSVQLFKYTL